MQRASVKLIEWLKDTIKRYALDSLFERVLRSPKVFPKALKIEKLKQFIVKLQVHKINIFPKT